MKKIFYILIFPMCGFSQQMAPDTIEFIPLLASKEQNISRDSVLKRTFYKTQNPTVYFFDESNSVYDNKIMMAVPKDSGFKIYELWDVTDRKAMKFERMDFDGSGSPELVIKWKREWSHMCATYSMKSEDRGTQILNLDKLEFYFDNHDYSKTDWEESPDPYEGERPKAIPKTSFENTAEETEDNHMHKVFIKKKTVSIARIKQGAGGIKYVPIATYKLKQQALVKVKNKPR